MNGLLLIVAAIALAYFWQRGSLPRFLAWFKLAAKPKDWPPGAGPGLVGGGGGSW